MSTTVKIAGVLLVFLAGCHLPGSLESFKMPEGSGGGIKTAAFELQCPESELQVVEGAPGSIGVSGCGKRAVYVYQGQAGWRNDTGVQAQNQPSDKK